jgi:predicted metal-dependent hydrolase
VTGTLPALPLNETPLAAALEDPAVAARVHVTVSTRARRVSLRVDPRAARIVLVRPPRMSDVAVMRFVASKAAWIETHLRKLTPSVAFADGATILYRGADHIVRLRPEARGGVWQEAETREIVVTGRPEHAARRLRDWLKAEARKALTMQVQALALLLGVRVTRITVRDTRSRWGSCTRDGKVSFSWRLIMAPANVLTYVAAHEVAHLKHMDHGPRFWQTVASLLESMPAMERENGSVDLAREWLARRGAALHSYG